MDERRAAIERLWTDGDYAAVGDGFAPVGRQVVADHVRAGMDVVDAATGTGNTAIAAAEAGARVTAFDLTPALLDEARRRADAAGVEVDLVVGDLVDVPLPDDSADVVLSTFGAFLADDPAACANELVRVCRPGGTVVVTAWAPSSAFLAIQRVAQDLEPELVPDVSGGPWPHRDRVLDLVTDLPVADVALRERDLWLPFPTAEAALAFYEDTSGPVRSLRDAAEGRGGYAPIRAAIIDTWVQISRPAGPGIELPATWTEATLSLEP